MSAAAAVPDLYKLRQSAAVITDRRRVAWGALHDSERAIVCRAACLDPSLADLAWDALPECAQVQISAAVRVMASLVNRVRF